MEQCNTCNRTNDGKDGFLVPTYRNGKYRNICWDCHRERSRTYRKKFRDSRKQILIDAKNVPCTDCGNRFHHSAMDFDHVYGDKLFNIGDGYHNGTLDDIKLEISKCEVVCSNCHRVRTYRRNNGH